MKILRSLVFLSLIFAIWNFSAVAETPQPCFALKDRSCEFLVGHGTQDKCTLGCELKNPALPHHPDMNPYVCKWIVQDGKNFFQEVRNVQNSSVSRAYAVTNGTGYENVFEIISDKTRVICEKVDFCKQCIPDSTVKGKINCVHGANDGGNEQSIFYHQAVGGPECEVKAKNE
jgi:hypothetical protein